MDRVRGAKIVVVPTDRIDALEVMAPKFCREILGMEYEDCFISDESELCDFPGDEAAYYERIARVYGVDVRDTDGNIAAILERLRLLSGAC